MPGKEHFFCPLFRAAVARLWKASSRPCAGDRSHHRFGRGQDPLTRADLAGWSRDGSRGSPPFPPCGGPLRTAASMASCRMAPASCRRGSAAVAALRRHPASVRPHRAGGLGGKGLFPPTPPFISSLFRRAAATKGTAGIVPRQRPGPSGPLGQARGPSPARPSWRDAAGIPARRPHCTCEIDYVSIPHAGYAKNPQKTRVFRGFRLAAIGRIVVYWCSVRGHRGPGMKVARAGASNTRGPGPQAL